MSWPTRWERFSLSPRERAGVRENATTLFNPGPFESHRMSSFIETLNQWGGNFLNFAWPMLWQSSLLIAVLFAFNYLFRRKVRASIRYALWLVVLVKLCMPPMLALPTSPAWWLHKAPPPALAKPAPHYTVTYNDGPLPEASLVPLPAYVPPKPAMMPAAWLLLASAVISSFLLGWLLVRWWQITRVIRRAKTSGRLVALAGETQTVAGTKFNVQVKLTSNPMSPAVCGLFRPTILIPQSLVENFSDEQLRAVLLHELIHLRRRDIWVNFVQALLQIFYWWHPLVWLANARIRRVREEAVDDAVMLALRDDAESYAPTLLEVAKLALNRPLARPGLVGILESRHALRQRIERLVDFHPPRKAGLTLMSLLGVLAFTAVAVPMGNAPDKIIEPANLQTAKNKFPWPDPNFEGYKNINLMAQFLILDESQLRASIPSLANNRKPALISTDEANVLLTQLKQGGARYYDDYPGGISQPVISGAPQYYRIGGETNQGGSVACLTTNAGGNFTNIIAGFDIQMPATQPDWTPMNLILRALAQKNGTHFRLSLSFPIAGDNSQQTEITVPEGEAIAWVLNPPNDMGKCQIVLLIPLNSEDKLNVFREVQDAKLYYEMGRLNWAETLLKSALLLDAENGAAKYYLGLVQTSLQHPQVVPSIFGRQNIIGKLDHIQLDPFGPFMGVSLAEVVRELNEMARQNDPEKTGVDIIILTNSISSEPPAIDSVVINLPSPLMNVKLGDALEAVVQNASTRLKYSIMDGSIVFSMGDGSDIPILYSRHFALDAGKFMTAMQNVSGIKTNSIPAMARDFLKTLGVDLDVPGKSVFYGDRLGELFVKATKQDLDIVESAMEPFKSVEPQVHIKAMFLEVPKETLSLLQPFPELTNGVTILSAASFRKLMQTLEAKSGTETLAEPEVVTTSGRQTEMRATVIQTIITNYAFHAAGTNSAIYPQTDRVETGPVLDIIPYALSDDHTINLTLITSLKVFLGYDQPSTNAAGNYIKEYDVTLPVVLPSFRVQQTSAHVNLWDGQTVVLGKPQQHFYDGDKEVGAQPDYFVKTKKSRGQPDEVDKELLVFITVTLVDPAGDRIHSDEDSPFTKDGIPPQPK
jgi:beta-lactamase regulating signal transducer with metallopeptidase domain